MANSLKVQKDKIVAAVEAERQLIGGMLVDTSCENPGHCAIGAMLFAAGMSNRSLYQISIHPEHWPTKSRATRIMAREYGLTREFAAMIASENDDHTFLDRGDAVIRAVRLFPDEIESDLPVSRVLPTTEERTNE